MKQRRADPPEGMNDIDFNFNDMTALLEENHARVSSEASVCAQRRAEAAATVANEKQDGAKAEHPNNRYWDHDWEDDSVGPYNSDDDQCGCYSAFGKDDDGEVRHCGLECPYRD